MPSHYLNQCWNIVNLTLGNKLRWNLHWNQYIFIQENAFENVIWKMAAICLGLNVLRACYLAPLHSSSWSCEGGSGRRLSVRKPANVLHFHVRSISNTSWIDCDLPTHSTCYIKAVQHMYAFWNWVITWYGNASWPSQDQSSFFKQYKVWKYSIWYICKYIQIFICVWNPDIFLIWKSSITTASQSPSKPWSWQNTAYRAIQSASNYSHQILAFPSR